MPLARTNLTLPKDLMREVDQLAGPRGRSRYVAEAVAQRVKRDRLANAIRMSFGALRGTPHEMTPDQVLAWVREQRSEETE
jgi:metal-responsive CopG/Arc/MetJ family transcriptional regulator